MYILCSYEYIKLIKLEGGVEVITTNNGKNENEMKMKNADANSKKMQRTTIQCRARFGGEVFCLWEPAGKKKLQHVAVRINNYY
jgi:hypothetical protein